MRLSIYIYKSHDADLMAIADAGYSLSSIIRDVVINYANGTPIHLYMEEYINFDKNDKRSFRVSVFISDKETNAIFMLKHIKHRLVNSFCKNLVRNALVQENLIAYFSDERLVKLLQNESRMLNFKMFPNMISLNNYKHSVNVSFAGKVIHQEEKKGVPSMLQPVYNPSASLPDNDNNSGTLLFNQSAIVPEIRSNAVKTQQVVYDLNDNGDIVSSAISLNNADNLTTYNNTDVITNIKDDGSKTNEEIKTLDIDNNSTSENNGDVTIKKISDKRLLDLFNSV